MPIYSIDGTSGVFINTADAASALAAYDASCLNRQQYLAERAAAFVETARREDAVRSMTPEQLTSLTPGQKDDVLMFLVENFQQGIKTR
jgi:hypothetical protein